MSRLSRLPLAVAVAASLGATTSVAQQLEEVLVTAQKRAENLQDVPISVSAMQGSQSRMRLFPT